MRKGIIGLVTIILVWLSILALPPKEAHACSCAAAPSVQEELQRNAAVFSGKVTHIKESKGLIRSSADPVSVTFSVTNVWKGEPLKEMTVRTALSSASCGYGFEQDIEYVVYASRDPNGELQTTICSRTKPMKAADEDLAALGAGVEPDSSGGSSPTMERHLSVMQWVSLAAVFTASYFISSTGIRMLYGVYLTKRYVPDMLAAHKASEAGALPSTIHFGTRRKLQLTPILLSLAAALALTLVVYFIFG